MKLPFFKFKTQPLWYGIIKLIFQVSFVTFAILLILEYFEPGFATNWFNPLWLLILAVLSGIIVVSTKYD